MTPAGNCWHCGTPLPPEPPGRRDTCRGCGRELRCCRNCRHHDPASYNQCREPQAERVLEKDRGNFCDFFQMGGATAAPTPTAGGDALRQAAEALFKK